METLDITSLKIELSEFAKARAWGKFHSPKNLSMALTCESAELLEIFQWLTEQESHVNALSTEQKEHAAQELADIIIYAVRLADILDINLVMAIKQKIILNAQKYPLGANHE
jgi:dCTP diphosphatase